MTDNPKKQLVEKIASEQLVGKIPQRTLARVAGNIPVERFTEALDGLVEEEVLGKPSYDLREKQICYPFSPEVARRKGYL